LQRSEQVLTCSQSFDHFFRHVNGRPHAAQVFEGKSALARIFGMMSRIYRCSIKTCVRQAGRLKRLSQVFEQNTAEVEFGCLIELDLRPIWRKFG
jgi:hypothetical protein